MKNIFIVLICSLLLLSCGGGAQNNDTPNDNNSEIKNSQGSGSDTLKAEGDNTRTENKD